MASHRGDWRNYPENSLPAIENAIRAGADIIEVDLALTRDSVLVICHDRTIDYTTDGRGRIAELSLDSVLRCHLLTGHGIKTIHQIPTLREVVTRGSKLWTNSLWADLCGRLCDDAAHESSAEQIYGRHLSLGATIIQTERIELLVNYLRSRGLHD